MNRIQRLLARMLGDPMIAGSLSKVVTRGHTGRRITVDRDFYIAQKLAERSTLALRLSPWAWRVVHELRNAPVVALTPLALFRARPDDCSIHGWEEMGPPPVGRAPQGRYNRAGESVLYLSNSEEGVRLEVTAGRICIQKYAIYAPPLRIADLGSERASNRLHAAFDLAEKACVPGRSGPATYAFSNFLARSICRSGFDGFIVPGVRGSSSIRYYNVVLFRPEGTWRSWSKGPTGFRRDP
jgi:RES domain